MQHIALIPFLGILFAVEECLFGTIFSKTGQLSCWIKFECNSIKGGFASKELSLLIHRLHSLGSTSSILSAVFDWFTFEFA